MTMEEHCPHGSGNAVFCDECEREDRARAKRRHEKEMKEKERAAEFMELAKGLPAHTVAKIMREHMRGVDYMGSPKKHMAEGYAKKGEYGTKLRDERGLKKKLKEAPRATKEEKDARARQRAIAKEVKKLDSYAAHHGMRSKAMHTVILETESDVLVAWGEQIRREITVATTRRDNAQKTIDRERARHEVLNLELHRRKENASRGRRKS
jgi:hypothetical protein